MQSFCNGKNIFYMPTNLNALIRYKQIDSCLKNNRYGCSIFDLIEACSDALAEFRGSQKRISERTIRDDIRVLRSEILGFNAPIVFDEGVYLYEDESFNIFKRPIIEIEILQEVYNLLKEKKEELEEKAVESILNRIKNVLGDSAEEEKIETTSTQTLRTSTKRKAIDDNEIDKSEPTKKELLKINKMLDNDNLLSINKLTSDRISKEERPEVYLSLPSIRTENDNILLWKDIFELI
jgi:hypothetical protein